MAIGPDDIPPKVGETIRLDDDDIPPTSRVERLSDDPRFQRKAEREGSAKVDNKNTDKEDRLIENYISHLNLVINWGTYNEFLDAKEVIKWLKLNLTCKYPSIHKYRGSSFI